MAPSGTILQPRKAWRSVVTQPSTWPLRSHSWVKSWSSTMISSGRRCCTRACNAPMAQVAMLSALMAIAMRSSSRVPPRAGAHQPQLLGVLEQQLPGRGGPQRPAAHDQHRAYLGLQHTQALRHRRLRDVQALRGTLETALFDDGGQAFQRGGIVAAHGLLNVLGKP